MFRIQAMIDAAVADKVEERLKQTESEMKAWFAGEKKALSATQRKLQEAEQLLETKRSQEIESRLAERAINMEILETKKRAEFESRLGESLKAVAKTLEEKVEEKLKEHKAESPAKSSKKDDKVLVERLVAKQVSDAETRLEVGLKSLDAKVSKLKERGEKSTSHQRTQDTMEIEKQITWLETRLEEGLKKLDSKISSKLQENESNNSLKESSKVESSVQVTERETRVVAETEETEVTLTVEKNHDRLGEMEV